MKHLALAALFVLALAGCSTTPAATPSATSVDLFQLVGPADLAYPSGSIEIQFGLRVENTGPDAIRLRQIHMMPVGMGGPYEVRNRVYFFNEEVAARGKRDIAFWARAEAEGDMFAPDANAPTTVRAIAIFESPKGGFRKVLMKAFRQRGLGPAAGQ